MTINNSPPQPTLGGDGRYCTHHDDDPAHTEECYKAEFAPQPVDVAGAPSPELRAEDMSRDELRAAVEYHRTQAARYSNEGAKVWRLRLAMGRPVDIDITMENERLARRATQPATTPSDDEIVARDEIVAAITDMQEGRNSHQQWLDHLSNPEREECKGCDDHAVHVGDIEHHRQWIEKYDRAVRLLARVAFTATPPDVTERARRTALRLKHDADDQFAMPVPDDPIVTIWTAIIAAEFREGEKS